MLLKYQIVDNNCKFDGFIYSEIYLKKKLRDAQTDYECYNSNVTHGGIQTKAPSYERNSKKLPN